MKSVEFRAFRILHAILVWGCAVGCYSLIAASVYFDLETHCASKLTMIAVALMDLACAFLVWRIFSIEYGIYKCLNHSAIFQEVIRPLRKIGNDFYSNSDANDPLLLRLPWTAVGCVYFVAVVTVCSFLPKATAITILIIPEAFTTAIVFAFIIVTINMRLKRWGMDNSIICIRPGLSVDVRRAHRYYKNVKPETSRRKSTAP